MEKLCESRDQNRSFHNVRHKSYKTMRFILETERRRVNGDHRKILLNRIIYLYLCIYI